MMFKTLLAATALVLITSPALAQQGQMPPPGPGQGERQNPFERADANNDGFITREEVRAARTAAFTRLDTNRDGFLVREEMPPPQAGRGGRHQGDMGPDGPQPPAGVQGQAPMHDGDLFRRADTNSDGNVTRAEFDAATAGSQAQIAKRINDRKAQMFTRLDTNNDGIVSRAEADSARAMMEGRHGQQGGQGQRPAMPNPDTNNDQKVSLAEWLARPDPLFERGDANNDGRVSREEAAAFVRQGRGDQGRRPRPW